ncbi:MAG TPA: MBL fold metallo-hydrolase [Chloroflexota bacterium]|nr:MBL fold metallo-hydrolase [Chloroflexota bacterium]
MLHVRALASGSSGNAFLVRTATVTLLLEAGLPITRLRRYLTDEGVVPSDLTAILVSHEHRDHCLSAGDLASEGDAPVYAPLEALRASGIAGSTRACLLEPGQTVRFGDVRVTAFSVPHDAAAPVGFHVRVGDRTFVLATDLGETGGDVGDAVADADLVILEANHDTRMLHEGRYPYHLRRRIAGPTGHLSNTQAGALLAGRLRDDRVDVWLAHLSRNNNTIKAATTTVRTALRRAGLGEVQVAVAGRDRPSLTWNGSLRPRQLRLFEDA